MPNEAIPKEMRELPQWVGVRNSSKIPLSYVNNSTKAASSSSPDTWAPFEKITEAIVKKKLDYPGFVFNNNGIVGIDIDKGFGDDGFLSPLAIDIMKACGSYTEYSRSGRGMHIYVKGTLPFGGRNNRNGVEIYQSGRFFIVTGRRLIFPDLIENQEAIDYVVNKYFPDVIINSSGKTKTTNIYQPILQVEIGDKITFKTEYPDIPTGSRNISLTSLAGQLHNQGYPEKAILEEITKVNLTKCKPPLDKRELRQIVNSIMRYKRG